MSETIETETIETEKPVVRVWPALLYDDAPAAIRTLTEVFGFIEALVVPGDAEKIIAHAELRWPEGGGVMLGSIRACDGVHAQTKAGAASVYVNSDRAEQVDAIYRRCQQASLNIAQALHDTDYGSHGFTVADTEGNTWTFGTYRGA